MVSVQLLQHVPSREDRRAALRHAAEVMVPGARAIVVNESNGIVRKVRSRPQEEASQDSLFFHTFTSLESREDFDAAGLELSQVVGLGVLYWSRYRVMPRALVNLDVWLSTMPGAPALAKFMAGVGIKRGVGATFGGVP